MSSSEEYLDNLLKAITEGNAYEGPSPSMAQDVAGVEEEQGVSALEEPDTTMSMDDMEAVFASMGAETVEEGTQEAMPSDDGIPLDDSLLSGELALDDSLLSDELALDDSLLSDELALDDSLLSDELVPNDSMISDEMPVDESMLSDELTLDEGTLLDELALNEETAADELALDDSLLSDEPVLDDSMIPDEMPIDEGTLPDELALDEEMLSDESALDEGMLSDGLALDDSMLSDESTPDGEAITEDFTMDEAMPDELKLEESTEDNEASDDLSLDELGLGDLGLEDLGLEELGLEESDQGELGAGEDFALEDGAEIGEDFASEDGAGEGDGFAQEETGEDDADLSALLASMGGDDDLSEINDLLEKSDQGVAVDDDLMAMLDGASDGNSIDFFSGDEAVEDNPDDIREISPEELEERENSKSKKQKNKEEKEKKKREKKAKKAKKAKGENASQDENAGEEGADDLSGLLEGVDENGEKPEKKGFFAKFIDFLLEEDEEEGEGDSEDVGVVIGNLSEENKELLAELKAEDKKNAKKKDKKDKKAKKGKKGKAEGDDDEEEAAAKPKKPKKEKKKKEKTVEEEPQVPEKRLSKKRVASVFLFCATIAACIVVVTILLPEQLEKQEARVAFDQSQYTQVYELLHGKELSEEDELLLQKSSTILKLQRKLDSYGNYKKMEMPLEALNALLEGVSRYQNLRDDAELYNVSSELAGIYGQILDALANNYGLSESDALDIIASGDDMTYSQRVQSVILGESFSKEEEEEEVPEVKQDVLPEEEEIIDRLEGTETE